MRLVDHEAVFTDEAQPNQRRLNYLFWYQQKQTSFTKDLLHRNFFFYELHYISSNFGKIF